MADTRAINPWTWQDEYGFSQAVDCASPRRWLLCSGQTSVDATGQPLHAGDMAAQLRQAFDNLEAVLRAADMDLANVIRLNYYVTDVGQYLASAGVVAERFAAAGGVPPAGTLLGVSSLFHPDVMVEVEATAAA